MIDFIIKYWIEFLFTGVIAIFGIFGRKISNLIKEGIDAKNEEEYQEFKERLTNECAIRKLEPVVNELHNKVDILEPSVSTMTNRMNEMHDKIDVISDAMLSLLGRGFKSDCEYLLKEDREITLKEFQKLSKDYMVYKSLKGNGEGDRLFNLVKKKFEKQF